MSYASEDFRRVRRLHRRLGAERDFEPWFDKTHIFAGDDWKDVINNAIKYRSDVSPAIHVAVSEEPGEHVFSVIDNGIGIDPKYFDRIFLIFQRLHDRGAYPGTGIGLALCKKIVEHHGGKLWVTSQAGRGSTFYFSIPVREAVHDDARVR